MTVAMTSQVCLGIELAAAGAVLWEEGEATLGKAFNVGKGFHVIPKAGDFPGKNEPGPCHSIGLRHVPCVSHHTWNALSKAHSIDVSRPTRGGRVLKGTSLVGLQSRVALHSGIICSHKIEQVKPSKIIFKLRESL